MKTVQLNLDQKQLAVIFQALGIAEQQFSNIHKQIVDSTIGVRGMRYDGELNPIASKAQKEHALYYHELGSACCDVLMELKAQIENPTHNPE